MALELRSSQDLAIVTKSAQGTGSAHGSPGSPVDVRPESLVLADGHAMLIAPSNAVHTFFMRFSIDLAFVTREGLVVTESVCLKVVHSPASSPILSFTAWTCGSSMKTAARDPCP
jgi:hypothetical protein